MKLNKNSISARLYRWFYITESMPSNLCPYFWKLVAMWILIVPASLISAPILIANRGDKINEWTPRITGGLLLYGVAFILFLMFFAPISYIYYGWIKNYIQWQTGGVLAWMVTILALIIIGTFELYNRRKAAKERKLYKFIWDEEGNYIENPEYREPEEKTYIIREFIKAKYNRYCPKIDWK